MTSAALRNMYTSNAVETVSPGRLVVMLYDRLALDLRRAETALQEADLPAAHAALVHGQDIVTELHSALDPQQWPPAVALGEVYTFLFDQLVLANVRKDPVIVASCRDVIEPLREAWSEAAGLGTSEERVA